MQLASGSLSNNGNLNGSQSVQSVAIVGSRVSVIGRLLRCVLNDAEIMRISNANELFFLVGL